MPRVEQQLPFPSSEGLPTCLDILPDAELTSHTEPCFLQLKAAWGGSVPHLSAVRSPALSALLSAVLGVATVLFWAPVLATRDKLTPQLSV